MTLTTCLNAWPGIILASRFVGSVRPGIRRYIAGLCVFAIVLTVAYLLTMFLLPRLPDFRAAGDGGVGIAYNFICKIATMLMAPAISCFLIGLLLHTATRATSVTPKA